MKLQQVEMPNDYGEPIAQRVMNRILTGNAEGVYKHKVCSTKNNEVKIPIKQTGQCQNCGARCGGLFGFCKQCV